MGSGEVYNYPKGIKAFYMRLNDDNETVRLQLAKRISRKALS